MNTILKPGIDFCICTYNRVDYLKKCVGALLPQMLEGSTRLTIVDNQSTDETRKYVLSLEKQNPLIRYISEPAQGSSHARNAGWKASDFQWIFYLDDDCLPEDDFVKHGLAVIAQHPSYDVLGGPYYPIFSITPPEWLPDGFGSFSMPFNACTTITKGFLRGGSFLIQREVFNVIGGFDTSLGMQGVKMRYGEEIELQMRMREAGMQLGYAPELKIGHHVRNEKLTLRWVLRSEYARRRDKMIFNPIPLHLATLHLLRTMLGRLIWTPVHLIQLLTRKSYTYERAMFDIFKPLFFRAGEWVGVVIQSTNRRKKEN